MGIAHRGRLPGAPTYRLPLALRPMNRPSKLIFPLLALVALAALVVTASGCGTTTADTARGRTLFVQKCGVCHMLAQAGTTAQVGPNLDDAFAAARDDRQRQRHDRRSRQGAGRVPAREQRRPPRLDAARHRHRPGPRRRRRLRRRMGRRSRRRPARSRRRPRRPGLRQQRLWRLPHLQSRRLRRRRPARPSKKSLPRPDRSDIEEIVVNPNAEIAKGYPPNVMPQNFGDISAKEIEDLVEYLSKTRCRRRPGRREIQG